MRLRIIEHSTTEPRRRGPLRPDEADLLERLANCHEAKGLKSDAHWYMTRLRLYGLSGWEMECARRVLAREGF